MASSDIELACHRLGWLVELAKGDGKAVRRHPRLHEGSAHDNVCVTGSGSGGLNIAHGLYQASGDPGLSE